MIFRLNGIGKYGPDSTIGPACWPYYDLLVMMEGSLVLEWGRRRSSLFVNDAVLIPPHTHFQGTIGTGGGTIWVQHFSAAPAELPKSVFRTSGKQILRFAAGSEMATALLRRLHALHQTDGRESQRLYFMLFSVLLLELDQAARTPRLEVGEFARLQPAVSWAEQYLEQAKNLRVVARQAELSESHFRNLFRRWRGQSAGAWLRERRMEKARQLLASTGLPLKDIGIQVGFCDVVGFSRSFRQFHGLPPGRFRRANPRPV